MAYKVCGMTRVLPVLLVPLVLSMLAACAGSSGKIPAVRPTTAAPDWHELLVAPFGVARKDIHVEMRETFLFGADQPAEPTGIEGNNNIAPNDEECFSLSRGLPQMFRIVPDSYVLCFYHDHLMRVEALLPVSTLKIDSLWEEICGRAAKNCEARHGSVVFKAALPDAPAPEASPANSTSARGEPPLSDASLLADTTAPQTVLVSVTLYDETYLPQ